MSDIESKYGEPDEVRSRLAMFMASRSSTLEGTQIGAKLARQHADCLESEFRELYDAWEAMRAENSEDG